MLRGWRGCCKIRGEEGKGLIPESVGGFEPEGVVATILNSLYMSVLQIWK